MRLIERVQQTVSLTVKHITILSRTVARYVKRICNNSGFTISKSCKST
jgi:hypothetical protein